MIQVSVTPSLLVGLGVPLSVAESDAPWMSYCCTIFEINTPNRLAHFLGQCVKECNYGKNFVEIGAGTGRRTSNRTGYGWAQLTSHRNQDAYTSYLQSESRPDVDYVPRENVRDNPYALAELPWRVHSAAWYWKNDYKNANQYADRGVTRDQVRNVVAHVWRPLDCYYKDGRLVGSCATVAPRFDIAKRAKRLIDAGRAGFRQGGVIPSPTSGGYSKPAENQRFTQGWGDDPFGGDAPQWGADVANRILDLFGRRGRPYGGGYAPEASQAGGSQAGVSPLLVAGAAVAVGALLLPAD